MKPLKVISVQEPIKDIYGIIDLDIVDFKRHCIFEKTSDGYKAVSNILINGCVLVDVRVRDFGKYPERNDWPGWSHAPRNIPEKENKHVRIMKKFWDYIHYIQPEVEVYLGDSPDFRLLAPEGSKKISVYGDIGAVSVDAFVSSFFKMRVGDFWISLIEEGMRHILIIPLYNVHEHFSLVSRAVKNFSTLKTQ